MAESRNKSLDALKGLAILIVMFGHVQQWNEMQDSYLYTGIELIQMPLFMAVSGYISGMSRRYMNFENFRKILWKRTIAYLLPFFVWMVFVNVVRNPQNILHPVRIGNVILVTLRNPDNGLWFLLTLYMLTVILLLAQLVEHKVGFLGFWLVIVLMFSGLMLQYYYFKLDYLAPTYTIQYMPFFLGAYLVSRYKSFIENVCKPIYCRIMFYLSLLCVFGYVFFVSQLQPAIFMMAYRKAAAFMACYACFYVIVNRRLESKGMKLLGILGMYTLEIYVLHIHFTKLIPKPEGITFWSAQGFFFAFCVFVVMSSITAVCIFLMKKIWILDFLFLGKKREKKKESI